MLTNRALSLVSLCLTLIIVEFVLRSIIPLNPGSPAEFCIPHLFLGWVLQPSVTYRYQLPKATVSVNYNREGWHDVEHTFEKPDDTFRIVVLGDSFMEAYSVDLKDAFHRRVEELARAAGSNTEVINLGVAGYGTLQEYLVFRDIGQRYELDLVLLGFFVSNDVVNNSLELESIRNPQGTMTVARPDLDPNETKRWVVFPVN